MTYLELQHEAEALEQLARRSIRVEVVSDMPLLPWFDLFLRRAWGRLGVRAEIVRRTWPERWMAEESAVRIVWPSREAECSDVERPGIWISRERLSDPLRQFYGDIWLKREELPLPAGSMCLDLERIMARLGVEHCLAREERRWGDCYSKALQEQVAEQAVRLWQTTQGRRKKCIVLDCDGVLWGRILSEDGLEGILLSETGKGQAYYEFQRLLRQLKEHGILLTICSKNEEADVRQAFRKHTAMVLQEEDIAAWSVSWQPKSVQMEGLIRALNLDPQDMVFVDDQEWELAEVRSAFPQIAGVQFKKDTIGAELAKLICLTPEDQNEQNQLRLQTYQDNQKREELKRQSGSYEEFLKRLNTQVRVEKAGPSDWPRISDLSRRANQCTNGIRYTVKQLQELTSGAYELYAVFVSDVYRDLGLVGCVGLNRAEQSVDLFCLSCRALGRQLEMQLLQQLPEWVQKVKWQDTGKNQWLKERIQQEGRFV